MAIVPTPFYTSPLDLSALQQAPGRSGGGIADILKVLENFTRMRRPEAADPAELSDEDFEAWLTGKKPEEVDEPTEPELPQPYSSRTPAIDPVMAAYFRRR